MKTLLKVINREMLFPDQNSEDGLESYWVVFCKWNSKVFRPFFYPFSPAKAPNLAELRNPITRQGIELESYPNHSRIQQVLWSKLKTFFIFRWGISGGDVTEKACFENFSLLWPALGPKPLTHSFGSEFCWTRKTKSRSASIDPWIDLLAYL